MYFDLGDLKLSFQLAESHKAIFDYLYYRKLTSGIKSMNDLSKVLISQRIDLNNISSIQKRKLFKKLTIN